MLFEMVEMLFSRVLCDDVSPLGVCLCLCGVSDRLLSLQSESVALKSEHGQCAASLSTQTEALRSSFREQMRHLQDEHCSTVETLQQQISRLEAQLFQLQKEPSSCSSSGEREPLTLMTLPRAQRV